jgi:hypothetical protein
MKLAVLALLVFPSIAVAQTAQTPNPDYKEPASARMYSYFVPGGGQIYTGKTVKGAALAVVAYGSFIGAAPTNPYVGLLGYIAVDVYSIYTAGGDAKDYNEEHHLTRFTSAPVISPVIQFASVGTKRTTNIGLSIHL